jgi:hypothetical protein
MTKQRVGAALAVLVILGCGGKPGKGKVEEPGEPQAAQKGEAAPAEKPAVPAEPEQPPLPEVTALQDTRELSWWGKLGGLDELEWIVALGNESLTAAGGPVIERTIIFVLKRSGAGWQWVLTHSDGAFTAGEEGLIVTQVPEGSSEPRQAFVEYAAVPDTALDALEDAVGKTPIPKKPTPEEWELLQVEVSTETDHVKDYSPGSISELQLVKWPPDKPSKSKSKSLGEMAVRLSSILKASKP